MIISYVQTGFVTNFQQISIKNITCSYQILPDYDWRNRFRTIVDIGHFGELWAYSIRVLDSVSWSWILRLQDTSSN